MIEFVATSIARGLIARMEATHARRRISVFSGPPGIGKTTAIDEFSRRRRGEVAVIKIARQNARETLVLQHVLDALRNFSETSFVHTPTSIWELRNAVFGTICRWAGADSVPARRGEYDPAAFPRLTLIFDEAQNLSREAIESLRYWNDADRCYAPFPVALVFAGNNEFSLAAAGTCSESVISAAVADRALYIQTFAYDDVLDDDLELFIEARATCEPGATAALVSAFRGPRSLRSLRRLRDLLHELQLTTGERTITQEDVRQHLASA
jgi:hypothetical protein